MRSARTTALLLRFVVGAALTVKVVVLLIAVMTVPEAKTPVPLFTKTGMPTRKPLVVLTVMVVPLLIAPEAER
jgi:hypothetical protein